MGQSTAVRHDDSVRAEELIFHEIEKNKSIKQAFSIPRRKLQGGLVLSLGQRKVEGFEDEKHILIQEPKEGIKPTEWRRPTDGITLSGGKIPYQLVQRNGFDNLRDYLNTLFRDEGYSEHLELKEVRDPDEGDLIALRLVKKAVNKHYLQNGH